MHEHFRVNFLLVKEHGFNLSELDMMFPYERDIYVMQLIKYLEDKQKSHGAF